MSDTTSKDDELEVAYRQEAQYALHLLSLPAEDRPVHIMLRAKELLAARKQCGIQERIDETSRSLHRGYFIPEMEIIAEGRIAELTALKTKQEVAN